MPLIDARRIEAGTTLDADVCIAGSGPAGLSLAMALGRGGRRVLLLESGGFEPDAADDDLYAFENAGAPLGPGLLREQRFGGARWYGRVVPMDRIVFEGRPWAGIDAWPVSAAEIERYYPAAAEFLGFDAGSSPNDDIRPEGAAARVLHGGGLRPALHLISRRKDLGERHRRRVDAMRTITAVLNAAVLGIEVDEAGRIARAFRVAATGTRSEFTARARTFVLACGGLENARLLLLLSAERPGVLGPSEASLGRWYLNHPRAEGVGRLYLDPAHADYVALFRDLTEHWDRTRRYATQVAVALDERTQREEGLLSAAAFFFPASDTRLADLRAPLDRLREAIRRRRFERDDLGRIARLTRELPLLTSALVARLRRRPCRLDHLVMVDQLEQVPDERSRLGLSDDRDRFGRPRLRVEWHVSAETRRTHRRFHQLLAERIRRAGVGTLKSALLEDPCFEPCYEDNAHPMGATRMSREPRSGVVDADCRVHALSNLYVAGSSVFPSGGQANPTLTIAALSLRLADHLLR
ncbi:MAG TPA: GMC oxidoreductase [Vicinamibacterales bacterium]|nr:GMC oxidoreductase [Vicinamibacterales bacterium]